MRDSFICMTIAFQLVSDKKATLEKTDEKKRQKRLIFYFTVEWPEQDFELIQL